MPNESAIAQVIVMCVWRIYFEITHTSACSTIYISDAGLQDRTGQDLCSPYMLQSIC